LESRIRTLRPAASGARPAVVDRWPAGTKPYTDEFDDRQWADFFGWPDDERLFADS